MPRYYEDKPEGGACAGVKEDLGACLLESDCVLQLLNLVNLHQNHLEEGKSPRQCLKEGYCKALKYSFFECKRSMLDARSRFRGRKGY
ncbi:PREDICTED: cytochrome c oxidase assembly factor 5 isoform X1 [Propithecus coquereli]|uniref:cytochrome c oxidase assembly factor 5 isoform X1 n=1 Tax=Propithecus coquereli TaxID=379532 RepID=UPI00063F024B|nr:PREDICTED: cytochrome c oxidase assembly factor 5 isoform X1 [Propithecus coquereli]